MRREPVPALPKSRTVELEQAADAEAVHPPGTLAEARHAGAERPHRGTGAEHVLGLEQTLDGGLADRDRPEHQRAMRDRLVAGDADATSGPFGAAEGQGAAAWAIGGNRRRGR